MKFIELFVKNSKGGVSTILLNVDRITYVTYAVNSKIGENIIYCEDGEQYIVCQDMEFIFNFSVNFVWTSECREDFFNIEKINYIKKSSTQQGTLYFLSLKGVPNVIGITHDVFDEIKNKSL